MDEILYQLCYVFLMMGFLLPVSMVMSIFLLGINITDPREQKVVEEFFISCYIIGILGWILLYITMKYLDINSLPM